MRNKVNDNFNTIINFIKSSDHEIDHFEILRFVLDYDLFKEYYPNYYIFCDLVADHNDQIRKKTWKPDA